MTGYAQQNNKILKPLAVLGERHQTHHKIKCNAALQVATDSPKTVTENKYLESPITFIASGFTLVPS